VAPTPLQLLRAISAISMGGKMVVPHVVDPQELPSGYVETSHVTETKMVPIDPNGWTFITDAMSRVLLPEGTAPSAHIPGIDIAGKTGSAQVVSLATRAKFKNSDDLAQNGWFVGFTPRRSPDIVVCVLFQGGEHGRLAARIATQVLKAYVDKQKRIPAKMAGNRVDGSEDMGALWTDPDADKVQGGRFDLNLPTRPIALATAAPGLVPTN
jgi:penicillin-binding protein 2